MVLRLAAALRARGDCSKVRCPPEQLRTMDNALPPIPVKRYFTIGEVGDLCGVKPHVLRYWEQEFTQLRPMKRRGNRRYYQHHEVLMIRRIRELLYEQGFTISGARNKLQEMAAQERGQPRAPVDGTGAETPAPVVDVTGVWPTSRLGMPVAPYSGDVRTELLKIRELLAM
jgi:DNA-binding transcriptional MerR regulator